MGHPQQARMVMDKAASYHLEEAHRMLEQFQAQNMQELTQKQNSYDQDGYEEDYCPGYGVGGPVLPPILRNTPLFDEIQTAADVTTRAMRLASKGKVKLKNGFIKDKDKDK